MKNYKVLCILPARGGSKGIKLKNIALLNGKPLLHYALTAALESKLIDRVVVSSDHTDILRLAEQYGRNIALKRPENISTDDASSLSVAMHALEVCESEDNCIYDYIVLLQATNPLVISMDIDDTVTKLQTTGCDSCVTVVSLGHLHPNKFKVLDEDKLLPFYEEEEDLVQRQQLQEAFIRNGSCYSVKRTILKLGSLVGKDVRGVETPKERYIDINDLIDMKIAECLIGMNS